MEKNIFKQLYDEIRFNFNTGAIAWLFHRVSGLLLALYFFMHAFVIGSAIMGGKSFDAALAKVQTPFFHLLEYGLVGVVFYHLLNGVRLVFVDITLLSKSHKLVFWLLAAVFVVFMAYSANIMFADLLGPVGGKQI
jgi:succinate dehydrogenase / fumarate reductase cytochrome b subunit